jgi:ATP-dependent helicase/nuclease subunit A
MLDEQLNGNIEAADSSKIVSLGDGRIDIEVISQGLTAPGKTAGKSRPSQKRNWQPFLDAWAKRRARYDAALIQPPFLTPTWFKQRDEESTEPPPGVSHRLLERTPALRIGELAHVFLQSWDFTAGTNRFREHLKALAEHSLLEQTEQARGQIEAELEAIFHGFFRSPVYGELAGARILGREVPLLMPWNGQVMEGVIDVIYERSGLLYLADYKTDRIEKKNLSQAATRYRQQAEIYSQAVRQSLGREPAAFKIIFLRLGEAVEIAGEENKQGALF